MFVFATAALLTGQGPIDQDFEYIRAF